jgi:hypothetical protein
MGLQPDIFFPYHLFAFFPHLPVQPKFFLMAASPIVLGHRWEPPFSAGSPTVLYQKLRKLSRPKMMWELIFSRLLKPHSPQDRSGHGDAQTITASTALKIAVFAPIPTAGVEITVLAPIYRTSSSRHHRGVGNPDRDVDPDQHDVADTSSALCWASHSFAGSANYS